MTQATKTRSLRRFQQDSLSRRDREVRAWADLTGEQKRASIACCIYGDCVDLATHWLPGTEWTIPDGPAGVCAVHAEIVRASQRDTADEPTSR